MSPRYEKAFQSVKTFQQCGVGLAHSDRTRLSKYFLRPDPLAIVAGARDLAPLVGRALGFSTNCHPAVEE